MKRNKLTSAKISHPELNGHASGALVASSKIVGIPHDHPRASGINTAGCNKDTGVDSAFYSPAGSYNADHEAYQNGRQGSEYEWKTLGFTVRVPRHSNIDRTCGQINWNG